MTERVRQGSVEPIQVRVPKHGTYKRRALALKEGLDPLIREAFDPVEFLMGNGKDPMLTWKLPEDVEIVIWSTWRCSDPRIQVRKEDPRHEEHSGHSNARREEFWRDADGDAKTVFFDAAPVLAQAKIYVEANRRERLAHEANEKARSDELGELPEVNGVHVERAPGDGLYSVTVSLSYSDLTAFQTKAIVRHLARLPKQ